MSEKAACVDDMLVEPLIGETLAEKKRGRKVLALSGGVGGAKLAHGLSCHLAADELMVVCNTGDDFEHLGLTICPDLDTVMYTLSGQANQAQGWGLENETWNVMARLSQLGAQDWFKLGDQDIVTHLLRTNLLVQGQTLSQATEQLCAMMDMPYTLIPMSDERVSTKVLTDQGELSFQHYFVREQCRPKVQGFEFDGADKASIQPELANLLADDAFDLIIICPSNPYLSIDPILAVNGFRQSLQATKSPVVAVSPIVNNQALKGPSAKIMAELGLPCSALTVAEHYQGLLDGFVLDESDVDLSPQIEQLGIEVMSTNTVMRNKQDRQDCAAMVLQFSQKISESRVSC